VQDLWHRDASEDDWDSLFQTHGNSTDVRIRKFLSIIACGRYALRLDRLDYLVPLQTVTELPFGVFVLSELLQAFPPSDRAFTRLLARFALVDELSCTFATLLDALVRTDPTPIATLSAVVDAPLSVLNCLFLLAASQFGNPPFLKKLTETLVGRMPFPLTASPDLAPPLRPLLARPGGGPQALVRFLQSADARFPIPDFDAQAVLDRAVAECEAPVADEVILIDPGEEYVDPGRPAPPPRERPKRKAAPAPRPVEPDDMDALMITGGLGVIAPIRRDRDDKHRPQRPK
jgi:hypothetical protein